MRKYKNVFSFQLTDSPGSLLFQGNKTLELIQLIKDLIGVAIQPVCTKYYFVLEQLVIFLQ